MNSHSKALPSPFIWRRVHSLTGLWLVVFTIQHLFTNSQAALWIGNDGSSFIKSVNSIQSFPYLQLIEIFLLGLPIAIHTIWGINRIFTAKLNSYTTDGSAPSLPEYPRNKAYSWQRITSWLLVIGIVAHVIHMRFIDYPEKTGKGLEHEYLVKLNEDSGLYTLANRLNVSLYNNDELKNLGTSIDSPKYLQKNSFQNDIPSPFKEAVVEQQSKEREKWLSTLQNQSLKQGQVLAVAPDFGTAELLVLRDTFKMPIMLVLYTLFVISACFHSFNGLWTFLITWGISLTQRSQQIIRHICTFLMIVTGFLGLAAIWGTYWLNLRS